jgi:protein required for attachment to host cells
MNSKMRIAKGDWLVVCDGRKALILENRGDGMFPNLHTKEVYEQPNPSTAAQGSDAPGRLHAAVGTARTTVEQTDWHDEAERAFLRSLARRLDTAVCSGETSALTMVASPRALGMIRADYSDAVRRALQREISKDLVKLPVHEIEKQLLLSGAAR